VRKVEKSPLCKYWKLSSKYMEVMQCISGVDVVGVGASGEVEKGGEKKRRKKKKKKEKKKRRRKRKRNEGVCVSLVSYVVCGQE
jgi:hypothetical protein